MLGTELGRKVSYNNAYNPKILYPIARASKRQDIGIDACSLPFVGFDGWNHYEVSWLNNKGKPIVAVAQIYYDCSSPFMVESKSLKLYFNSLNQTKFSSIADVTETVKKDLENVIKSSVVVIIKPMEQLSPIKIQAQFLGENLDELDIACDTYTVEPDFLSTSDTKTEEVLFSDLLKSNCLVTNQPDWGSVQITYKGKKINREGLLRYIISFRNHNEFHEQCIERMFVDITKRCKPEKLTIYGRYTRRGGLDINPYRSTENIDVKKLNVRLLRQ